MNSDGSGSQFSASDKRRILNVIFLTVFLDMIGFGMVFPLMPFYIKKLGGDSTTVGLIFTSFASMQLLATPIMGRLSDRYGRRKVILISLVGNAASMVMFALANQLWMIFVSRLIAGATAGNLGACQAVIADITSKEERAKDMGRLGAGIGLGMVLGPVMGSGLSHFGIWAPAVAAAIAALVDLGLALVWMPETRRSVLEAEAVNAEAASKKPGPTFMQAISERRLLMVMGITFLTFYCLSNLQVAMALLSQERLGWGEKESGYMFTLFGVTTLVVQGGLIGRMVKALGELNLLLLGAVVIFTGMVTISQAYSPIALILGAALFAFGVAVTNPCVSSLASRYAPRDMQGAVLGISQSAGGLARAVGPAVGGYLFHFGAGLPFVGGAIAAALSLGIGLVLKSQSTIDAPAG